MSTTDDDRRPFALVVDDDVLILMDTVDILSDAGFRPLEAHDVDAAEAVLVEYADEITLLFTDVQMPGTRDGFALARMTAERWPAIGVFWSALDWLPPTLAKCRTALYFCRSLFHRP